MVRKIDLIIAVLIIIVLEKQMFINFSSRQTRIMSDYSNIIATNLKK